MNCSGAYEGHEAWSHIPKIAEQVHEAVDSNACIDVILWLCRHGAKVTTAVHVASGGSVGEILRLIQLVNEGKDKDCVYYMQAFRMFFKGKSKM